MYFQKKFSWFKSSLMKDDSWSQILSLSLKQYLSSCAIKYLVRFKSNTNHQGDKAKLNQAIHFVILFIKVYWFSFLFNKFWNERASCIRIFNRFDLLWMDSMLFQLNYYTCLSLNSRFLEIIFVSPNYMSTSVFIF